MRPLRLSSQILLAVGLLLAVAAALLGGNLLVTRRLTEAHRTIVESAVPAVRLELGLFEAVAALRRIEARHRVLRDDAFRALFVERIRGTLLDLDQLERLLDTAAELDLVREARAQVVEYGRLAGRAGGPAPDAASHPATRLEDTIYRLYQQSDAELRRRQREAEALSARTRLLAMVVVAGAALASAAIAALAVLRVARPLRRLQAATQRVAAGEFSEPIPVRGPGEIADLTAAFNRMAAGLREVDRTKDEFFTAVSHDLRTPLAAIRWSADVLRSGGFGPLTPKQMRLAEGIQASSKRLLALVGQIVELGRLRAGRLQLDRQPTHLSRVVAEAVEEIRPLAEEAHVRLEAGVDPDLPPITADQNRVYQALLNLLGNAVRFTPAGGRVSIAVDVEDAEVVVKVADTGVGIPRELLPKVFDLYEQAHRGRGGSGIGLTVVRGIVLAHGGRVSVDSEEGRGSCFRFTLPLEPQPVGGPKA